MSIGPEQVKNLLLKHYPEAKVIVVDRGISKKHGFEVNVYDIKTELFGISIFFRLSDVLTFVVEDAPMRVLKHLPLLHSDTPPKFINNLLNNLDYFLKLKELPKSKALARKYLGQEKDVKVGTRLVSINYGDFFIRISPIFAGLYTRRHKHLVYHIELDKESDLEEFFKGSKSRVEAILQGRL